MAQRKITDLSELSVVALDDWVFVRDITDGFDKKIQVDNLLASRIGGDTGSTSNAILIASGTGGKTLQAATDAIIDLNGQMALGGSVANAMLDIICRAADVTGLKIKAAENQTADLLKIIDDEENALFIINYKGDTGITVQSPNEPFHVQSDYDGNRAIRMGNESNGSFAVGRFIVDVLGGSTFLAGYGSNFTTSGSKRANSGSLIANAAMGGGLSLVARHATTGHIRWYTGGNADVNERGIILANGNWGINTTEPDKIFEINKSTGGEMRLSYNAPNGSAIDYCDFGVDSNGGLTITTVDSDGAVGHINLNPDGNLNIQNGHVVFSGSARFKFSDWVSASGLKALPTQEATWVDYGIGGAWQFADAVTKAISGRLGYPKGIDTSANLYIRFGWSCPTADPGDNSKQVRWEVKYSWRKLNEPMDAAADATVVNNYTTSQTAKGLVVTDALINAPDSDDLCLGIILSRIGGDSGDTAGDVAYLFGMCTYYTKKELGEY